MKYKILFNLIIFFQLGFTQSLVDSNIPNRLFHLYRNEINDDLFSANQLFNIKFSHTLYQNSNLPNIENINGLYLPKGFGAYSSMFLKFNAENISISFEPVIFLKKQYKVKVPEKVKSFSVMNDIPNDSYRESRFRNTGITFKNNFISAGYGNWNQWWGSGIHSSLILSNNAQGFYHYFVGSRGFQKISNKLLYEYKYQVSEKIQNDKGDNYFFSAWYLNFKYRTFEFGLASNTLSGGYNDIQWSLDDALLLLFTKKNKKYWDTTNHLFLKSYIPDSELTIFIEIGIPQQNFNEIIFEYPYDHGFGSNIGLRKLGLFQNDYLLFGFEYTRLLQAINYNRLPSSNWYDNIKYDYSSFRGRRWGAHSGSDSDDLLLYVGYMDSNKGFLYEINYERHGVTYHFPPEVKLENRILASYFAKNATISIIYENEHIEHYGFIDSNLNVWNETFEPGSIQRTKTILFSIDYQLF